METVKAKERTKERENTTTTTTSASLSWVGRRIRPLALDWARRFGYDVALVDKWIAYEEEQDWRFSTGTPVTALNFRRPLRMFMLVEREIAARQARRAANRAEHRATQEEREQERLRERQRVLAEDRREKIAAKPESWALCRERCKWAREGAGCSKGVRVPPDHAERPIPPEECPCFAERKANDE